MKKISYNIREDADKGDYLHNGVIPFFYRFFWTKMTDYIFLKITYSVERKKELEVSQVALKPKQIELLEAMLSNPMMPDTKLAELLNLNNKTVGKWRKEPEFQEELKKRLAEQWKNAERLAQKKMIELANEGCFQANKYILDSLGYAPTTKIEADINQDIIINIGGEEDE